mmetsp:Transcript_46455/g.115212  ORF Transcript_46455/g.115212 Transcript_46455/m.115212 type:complete len:414 (-) Transcript_46455:127-1368(-)
MSHTRMAEIVPGWRVSRLAYARMSREERSQAFRQAFDRMTPEQQSQVGRLALARMTREQRSKLFDKAQIDLHIKSIPGFANFLAAMQQDGMALQYVSDSLRNNLYIVLAAVERSPEAIQYASPFMQRHTRVVLAAVSRDGTVLRLLPWLATHNREVVLAAVRQNGLALQYAGEAARGDKVVVLAAVSHNGEAVQYARYTDFDIWLAAVSTSGSVLRLLSKDMIWMRSGTNADEASHERAIRELELAAVQSDWCALQYVGSKGKADRNIVLAAVRRDGRALQYASSELLADYLVVSTAVRCSGVQVVFFVSDAHRWDPRLSPWLQLSPSACAWRRVRGAISRAAIVAFWMHKTHLPHHAAMLQGMAAVTELMSPLPLGIDARVCSKCEHADTIDLQHESGEWWSGTLKDAFVSF